MTMIPAFLLQGDSGPAVGGGLLAMGGTMVLVMLAIGVVFLVAAWKMYVKAGQPGWAVLIPFYNFYIWLKIAGRPGWWLVLLLIPLVNLAIMVILAVDVAKAFGKSAMFGVVLLFLLGGIGCLVLGFGNAHYVKPATAVAR